MSFHHKISLKFSLPHWIMLCQFSFFWSRGNYITIPVILFEQANCQMSFYHKISLKFSLSHWIMLCQVFPFLELRNYYELNHFFWLIVRFEQANYQMPFHHEIFLKIVPTNYFVPSFFLELRNYYKFNHFIRTGQLSDVFPS